MAMRSLAGQRRRRQREEMTVHIEVRADESRDGLAEQLERRLRDDLGVAVGVNLVDEGALASDGSLGEGKVNRLLDRRSAVGTKA